MKITCYFASFLEWGDIQSLRLVCKKWHRHFENDTFWKYLCARDFATGNSNYPSWFESYVILQAKTLAKYKIVKYIAEGATSINYLVFHIVTGQFYCLKKISLENSDIESINTEIDALNSLKDCPYVIALYEVYQNTKFVYFIQEYVPGREIYHHLCIKKRFNVDLVRSILNQVLDGLDMIHSNGIMHRDIKPENLLITNDGHVYICDFGCSKVIDHQRSYDIAGTLDYLAPEVLKKIGHDKRVDIWAVGVLCYELLVGYPPFYSRGDEKMTEKKILSSDVEYPMFLTNDAISFMQSILIKDPLQRPSIFDLKYHEFLKTPSQEMYFSLTERFEISYDQEDFTEVYASFSKVVFMKK